MPEKIRTRAPSEGLFSQHSPPHSDTHTIAACLTPPGTGAIATLAIRGPRAWNVVRDLFHLSPDAKTGLPDRPEAGRIWLGRLGTDLADDVVLSVRQAEPNIYLELHCHGGREVVR